MEKESTPLVYAKRTSKSKQIMRVETPEERERRLQGYKDWRVKQINTNPLFKWQQKQKTKV